MNPFKPIAKQAYRKLLSLRARPQLRTLAAAGDEPSRWLAEALQEALAGRVTPEEARWVRSIEALRRRLDASQEPIEIVDYGAGTAEEARIDSPIQAGRVLHVPLGDISRVSKDALWGLLLFKLVRKFQPQACLELGTAVGISAAYQAAALTLDGGGTLATLEGAPSLARLAADNLRGLGLTNVEVIAGRFQDTLAGVLDARPPIGHAFIDGHHDGPATLAYFEALYPHLAERAVLVFDDILHYPSMRAAWNTLQADPRIPLSVDLARVGVCVLDRTLTPKATYTLPLI